MGRRKEAFLAGFAAGETEDDAQASWETYRDEQDAEATDEDTADNE